MHHPSGVLSKIQVTYQMLLKFARVPARVNISIFLHFYRVFSYYFFFVQKMNDKSHQILGNQLLHPNLLFFLYLHHIVLETNMYQKVCIFQEKMDFQGQLIFSIFQQIRLKFGL